MAYVLRGVVAPGGAAPPHGVRVLLGQGLILIPMTQPPTPPDLDSKLAAWSVAGPLAYVEAEYFGGVGSQLAAVWHEGIPVLGPLVKTEDDPPPARGMSPISRALRRLGATTRPDHYDEFDAVGLGRHRHVDGWLTEASPGP